MRLFVILVLAVFSTFAQTTGGSIRGVLTDDSGGVIPAAVVTLAGPGGQKTTQSQGDGTYAFNGLAPGQYTVRATVPGFSPFEQAVTLSSGTTQLPIQLSVTAEKQEVTVAADAGPSVSVEPDNNATALVLKGDDLAALPDDPDDLADALQALAGPAAGPNGGQIFVDGFSGGNLPPKESIREIRVNQNPFSAEFDRLGYGRIEILTKPGTDRYRGTLFLNDSDGVFNSQNPFAHNKPDYSNRMYGGNIGGPLGKRASFFFDFNRRQINDNAILVGKYLNPTTLLEQDINEAVVTPNTRNNIAPRLDYQLSTNNTLVARMEYGWNSRENAGLNGTALPPSLAPNLAYNSNGRNINVMVTETSILRPTVINETRVQFVNNRTQTFGNLQPQIDVAGSFITGGNDQGNSLNRSTHVELQNYTSIAHGVHTIRFGVRARRMGSITDSPAGFGGTFSFFGALAPVLDANNQPTGATAQITSLEQYRRTLLFQGLGYTPAQIRALGGGASQFNIIGGNPYASIVQYDAGPFIQDDWRVRSNFTVSLGLRYEIQTNVSDHRDIAPRFGFAWAPGNPKNGRQKTVIRGGFGIFYDRIGANLTMRTFQLNGINQLQYVVQNPDFYPTVPALSALTAQQNSIYRMSSDLRAPMTMQTAIGVERQLPHNTTVALTYTNTRAIHDLQTVPINAPLPGSTVRPYGNAGNLFLYESGGRLRQNIFIANFNTRFNRNVSLMGNYSLTYANDLPGTPSNPYNFNQDWGRSSLDRRNRFQLIGTVAAPFGLRLSPFLTLQSGSPYDVLVGRDLNGDTLTNDRPSIASGPGQDVVPTQFGYFNINPQPGSELVPRNYLTSAGLVSVNVRISKTIGFGEPRGANAGPMGGGGGGRMGGGGDHGGGGGGMRMGAGGGRGGPGGMFGESSNRRYNLTISAMFNNVLNHVNPTGYSGVLTSPLFAQPTGINTGFGGGPGGGFGGAAANNRRIELQLRFAF